MRTFHGVFDHRELKGCKLLETFFLTVKVILTLYEWKRRPELVRNASMKDYEVYLSRVSDPSG